MITIEEVPNQGTTKVETITSDTYYEPFINGKSTHCVCETEDIAMLVALGIKYQGPNSQFATMACRMLKIQSNWAL